MKRSGTPVATFAFAQFCANSCRAIFLAYGSEESPEHPEPVDPDYLVGSDHRRLLPTSYVFLRPGEANCWAHRVA